MKIYNSATHQKEDFRPIEEGKVRMYVCGPTVYDNIHIGNARTFISFDVIRRWLIASGYEVTFAQNLTDVDDKIINRANEQGRTFEDVHERLSEIVDEVSAEDISLDDALKLYEEAVKLGLSACDLSEQDLDAFLATEEETTAEEGGASATPTGSTDMPREA